MDHEILMDNSRFSDYTITTEDISTSLTEEQINCIKNDDIEGFKRMDLIVPETHGISLIHAVAFYNAIDIFQYLVEVKNVPIDKQTDHSLIPLHYACFSNAIDVASYILSKKPTLAQYITPSEGYQFIFYCCLSNAPEILLSLIEHGADPNLPENQYGSLFRTAISRHHTEIIRILMDNFSPEKYIDNITPLMHTIVHSVYDLIPLLLEYYQEDTNFEVEAALSVACKLEAPCEVIELLCQHCRWIDLPENQNGRSLVHSICLSTNPNIARIILNYPIDVNRADSMGLYGPDYLKENRPREAIEILDMLYEHGFNVNNIDTNGKSMLEKAFDAIQPSQEIIKWYIEHGADIRRKFHNSERTILDTITRIFCRNRDSLLAKYLSEHINNWNI